MTPPGSATSQPVQLPPGAPILPGQVPGAVNPPPADANKGPDSFGAANPKAPDAKGPAQNPLFGKFDPKKVNPENSKKLLAEGDKFIKSKQFEKAFKSYLKAFEADPKNEKLPLKLAAAAYNAKDPITAHEFVGIYLEMKPEDSQRRMMRVKLDTEILGAVKASAGKIKSDQEKAQATELVMGLITEMNMDQSLLLAYDGDKQLAELKKSEPELAKLHSQPIEKRKAVLAGMLQQINMLNSSLQMPYPTKEQAQMVKEKVTALLAELFGVAERFSKADSDEGIKKMGSTFEAYHLLAQGNIKDAVTPMETVRSEGFKSLGNGDEAKGKERFDKIRDEVRKAMKEGRGKDIPELIKDIPFGLDDANALLTAVETDKLRRTNLAALRIWKDRVHEDWTLARADADNSTFTGSVGAAWRGHWIKGITGWNVSVWGDNKTRYDDINEKTSFEEDLVSAVESRINKGEATTVLDALKLVRDKGDPRFKDRATDIIDHLDRDHVGLVIKYASQVTPDPKVEKALLDISSIGIVSSFGGDIRSVNDTNALIEFASKDPVTQKKAGDLVKKDKVTLDLKDVLASK